MRELTKEIMNIINSKLPNDQMREKLEDYHANSIAEGFDEIALFDRKRLYRILSPDFLAEIFTYLDNVEDYLHEMTNDQAASLIDNMDADEATEIIEEIDEEMSGAIMSLLTENRKDIELIQSISDLEIGSEMTTNYVAFNIDDSVRDAMKRLVKEAPDCDNIEIMFVNDKQGKYYGLVELRDLFKARAGTSVKAITKCSYPVFHINHIKEEAYDLLKEYNLPSVPIINDDHVLVGVITTDALLDMVEEQMNEDYLRLAGVHENEELHESTMISVKKRLPWLFTLMILGLGISLVISLFENVVYAFPVVVFFQSIILGMSGNAGTQSLAVTIKMISRGSLKRKDNLKIIRKESLIGLGNGVCLGLVAFGVVLAFLHIIKPVMQVDASRIALPFNNDIAFNVALSVGLAIFGSMFLSSFFGGFLPLLFNKLKIDPAVASGPFITTLNDVIGVVAYYSLVWILILGLT